MNRRITVLTLVVLVGILAASHASGQMIMRHGGGAEGGDEIIVLRELGVVAGPGEEDNEVRLMMLLPGTEREVALQKGDLILMVNGKRVRDVATLREAYDAADIGEVVKLGIRRGDERFLTSFEKKDPEEMEEGSGMRVMVGGPGGDFDDIHPLPEFGVLLAEKDGKVVVAMELPMGTPAFEKDDEVQSINGQTIASLEELRAAYEPLAVGDDVALVVLRDSDEIRATRAKVEQDGMIRMRSSH